MSRAGAADVIGTGRGVGAVGSASGTRAVRTHRTRFAFVRAKEMMRLGSHHSRCFGAKLPASLEMHALPKRWSVDYCDPAKSASDRTMPTPKQPKRKVRIDSEKYLIRTIEPDDVSDRWEIGRASCRERGRDR